MHLSVFVLFFTLIGFSQSGIVQPINRTPILVSSNNINEISSYTFTFTLETPTTAGDILVIKFPLAEYSHFSALVGTTCTAYLNPETFRTTNTNLACYYSSNKQFEITLVELNSGSLSPHSVTILGLQNPPSIGGTGNFQVETRRGLANTMDYNGAFNQLGFVASPSSFSAVTPTIIANTVVNQNGTYKIDITTTQIIPQYGFVLVTFPAGSKIYPDTVCTVSTVTANVCTRINDVTIKVTNFTADVPAATSFSITITKVLNLNYQGSSGNIKVQTWTDSVNTIIEQVNKAVPSPTPGQISSATAFYTNFQQTGLDLVPSDYTSYEISFRVVNPVPSSGAIEITLPMTPDYCIPFSGLNSIDESQKTKCTITGNKAKIITFKPLAYNQLVTVMLRATNPSATGATTSVLIQTFYDSSSTQLIDQLTSGLTFTISSAYTKMKSLALSLANTAGTAKGAWTITWQSPVQLDSTTVGTFDIVIPSGFTFDGTPVCTLKPASGSTTTVSCTLTGNILSLITSSAPGTFSNTADNTLTISSSNGGIYNAAAGDYPVIVKLKESPSTAYKRIQTIILTVTSATTLGATVSPLTLDRSRWTLYEIAFNAPIDLSPGIYPASNGDPKTTIRLEFQTASGTTALFAVDLGRNDTTNQTVIPCYGADALKPFLTTGKLRCILYFATASSSTTPAAIEVHDFAAISSGQRVTLQIPKIRNSDSMTTTASVAVYLRYSKNHISKIIYTNTVTLAASLLDAVVGSPNNTNGVAGIPTNLAPTFNPRLINQGSRAEVKLTPGPGRALPVGSKIILDFPALPYDSTTMQYIFGSSTRCEIGLGTTQPCLVFPEVGWIVIKNLVSAFSVGQEYSLTLFNINNPRSAAALNGQLRLVTVATTREYEEFFYTSFNAFKTGSLSNINIFPSRYEANQVDVEYNWIFVISNPIPSGGSIELRFPPNLYNLESDPPVTGTVITGLSNGASTTISFSFIINVVTIKGFAPVAAGTLIRISVKGVRNPIEATRTTNFAIVTKDALSYLIDSELLITGLNILKANPVGVIVFNYFYTTPSNGKMRGNYYLSFYPQSDYPKGTTIQVIFPSTEFNSSSFQYTTCSISGALTTFKSCTAVPTLFRYEIVTDTRLEIEPGMLPINLFFPQIRNFNEELSSGVIVVRALYDGVVLDESGNAEDNRKATTSLAAKALSYGNFSVTPKTEGQIATYTVDLNVSSSFSMDTTIQFEFPWEYQRGLGEGVTCQAPAITISALRPIKCVVSNRIVNITGHTGFDKTVLPNGFRVSISGIVNPSTVSTITGTIAVFILTTPTYASEQTETLGSLTFTAAPKILDMTKFTTSNTKTRITADYGFQLAPTVAIPTNSRLLTQFSSAEYQVDVFSKTPTLTYASSATVSVTPVGNTIFYSLPGAITAGTSFPLTITGLANPLDEGEKRYPTIYCIDDSGFAVTARTYDNLIKPFNFKFFHNGEIVTINNDVATTIHPGQADKYTFKFQSPTTLPLTIHPTPLSSMYLQVSDIQVPVGSTEASIWIGVDSAATNDQAFIQWDIIGDTANRFWVIRPLEVDIVVGQTEIFVDEIVHVPAGGRTKALYVTLSKSPLTDLTILLYQRGSIPTEVNVYPSKLTFKKGELTKPFWVSSGRDTRGIMGSIMFLINGTNAGAYYMQKRLRSFIVSRGDTTAPLLFKQSMTATEDTYISLDVTTSEPCTIYYFVAPKGSLAPLFQDIKDKKIRYDYYGGEYVVGEYVDDDDDNQYIFNVNGLRPGTDYDAYFFIEDFSGNLGSQSFTYTFKTKTDYPKQVWINVLQSTALSVTDTAALLSTIASVLDITPSRLESDITTVTTSKSSGGAATGGEAFDNSGRPNRRVKLSAASFTPTSAGAGSVLFTFIVFPPIADPFESSNSQVVSDLLTNLNQVNTLFNGGGKINVAYGVQSNAVEPDDIKWASGTAVDYTVSTSTITVRGLKLNAAGKIHALAVTDTRPVYYSTQNSLQSAVRYLAETEFSLSAHERKLVSAYGQQECIASSSNELTVSCTGQNLPAPDRTRDDYDFYNSPPSPSSYQVATESDGSYFKGDAIGVVSYSAGGAATSVSLTGLKSGTKYTVYLAATDGYSKYPMRMMDQYIVKLTVTTVSTVQETISASVLTTCLSLLVILFGMMMM